MSPDDKSDHSCKSIIEPIAAMIAGAIVLAIAGALGGELMVVIVALIAVFATAN
jgi:hypothetical protein